MSRGSRALGWPGVLLILGVVAAVYAPQLGHAFQYDDDWKIVGNLRVRNPAFFAEDFRLGSYSEAVTRLLPNLSLALDYAWFGLSPFGYNLTNLFFHLCNVALVFVFARALAARMGGVSAHFAWLSAALFGVHPLNSEAVYYCNARPNLMLTTFYLAALCLLMASVESPRRTLRWLACALCAIAALACKEIAITLLVMAPMLVYWLSLAKPEPYAQWVARGKPWALGFGATALAVLFITGALAEVQRLSASRSLADLALIFADQSAIAFRYLGLWLAPWPGFLLIDHGALGHLEQRVAHGDAAAQLLWPVLASVALLALLLHAWRRRKLAALPTFAVFFVAIAHAPLWLMPRGDAMVEYRTYLPMVGLCLWLAYALDAGSAWLAERWHETPRALRLGGYSLLLASLCGLTILRGRAWATEDAMWQDVIAKAPQHARAYLALGELARRRGDTDRAIALLRKSVALDPSYERGHSSLGGLLTMRGELEAAKAELLRALALDPNDFQAANNLGNVLVSLHDPELATRYYEEALAIQPLFPEALLNLARMEHKLGQFEVAMTHYRRALQLAPYLPAAYLLTGRALMDHGDTQAAIEMWTRGLKVDARQPAMHAQLAQALFAIGQRDAALQHLQTATDLAPDNPDVIAARRAAVVAQGP